MLAIAHKRAQGESERELIAWLWDGSRSYEAEADRVQQILRERGVIEKANDLLAAYEEQAVNSLRALSSPTFKVLLRRVIGMIFGQRPMEGYCSEFETRNAAGREAGAERAS